MRPNRSSAAVTAACASAGSVTVEFDHKQVLGFAERRGDRTGVAAGGDDRVTGHEGGLGDVDAHAPPGTGDKPHLLGTHVLTALHCPDQVEAGRGDP
jgi:hypothetical protein